MRKVGLCIDARPPLLAYHPKSLDQLVRQPLLRHGHNFGSYMAKQANQSLGKMAPHYSARS